MPLRLTFLERVLARLNLLPMPLLDTPLAPGIAKAVTVACELKVFDALSEKALTLNALAEELQCNPQGLQLLLQLLVTTGYLHMKKGHYVNSQIAKRWLVSSSALNIAPYVLHSPDIVEIWNHLPEVVRDNQQAMVMPYEEDSTSPEMQELLARHYSGLASLAIALGNEIVRRVQLPRGAQQLLDIGGSHAAYSVLFCRKHPQLQATIIDLQAGIEAGKRTVIQEGMEDRIHFLCEDIVNGAFDLPACFDVALYFHIAHLLSPESNAALLARIAALLNPGGVLVFVDQITDQTFGSRLASLMVQLMALTMRIVGGTCYPFLTVKEWLEQANLGQVRRHRLLTPGATMITARKL